MFKRNRHPKHNPAATKQTPPPADNTATAKQETPPPSATKAADETTPPAAPVVMDFYKGDAPLFMESFSASRYDPDKYTAAFKGGNEPVITATFAFNVRVGGKAYKAGQTAIITRDAFRLLASYGDIREVLRDEQLALIDSAMVAKQKGKSAPAQDEESGKDAGQSGKTGENKAHDPIGG